MSSYDGGGFEEWLRESFMRPPSPRAWRRLLELLEPYRDIIDYYCDAFDEATQSWREYRNSLWDGIPDDVRDRVNEILNEAMIADDREIERVERATMDEAERRDP